MSEATGSCLSKHKTVLHTPNMDGPELHCIHFFFLNHKLCRHFQKDIQSQFNDTSLHSHALITHNPLPHPTYGLKTQGSNLSCALS